MSTKLATEVLAEATPPERNAGMRMWQTKRTSYDDLRDRYLSFSSQTFVDAYLAPDYQPGCGQHTDPDCLCDVKVSLSADITFDRASNDFVGISTAEELVEVAANIWLRYDLVPNVSDIRLSGPFLTAIENGELDEMLTAIKGGCTFDEAREYDTRITPIAFTLIRKAFGVAQKRNLLPKARVRELTAQGVSGKEIQDILREETGVKFTLTSISHYRKRAGISLPESYRRGGRPPVHDREKMYALFDQGMTARQVAAEIGCTYGFARDIYNRRAKMQ